MAIFKCKMCGGELEITKGELTAECSFCGSHQTLPRLDDDRKANLYDRANHFRRANDFDKAMGIYDQILNEDNTDAEAYWSIVLCRYGIEYVEDPSSHKRVPTVNRAQYTSIFADEDYKAALSNADLSQKLIYEQEAKAIDEIQKGILEISQKEEPFDVFICYKETDSSGRRTQDSVLANDLYHQLTQEGFKVFFSRITLEDKLGTAYEPYIFAALNSSKVMVVFGTKPEYFNAVWVKNEWSRYLALIKNGAKKMLIPAYRDMDPYDLPEEFSHLQAQDMSKLGFMQDLIRGIKKILDVDADKRAVKETVVVQQAATANLNVQALLKRGNMALEDGEWDKADGFFEEVLNQDAECAEAYLGKLLVREHKSSFDDYVTSQCNKYSAANSEKLEACPENIDAINDAVSKYVIENYVKEDEITSLFKYDRSYSSCLSEREEQKATQLDEVESDKLIVRIRQYISGDLEEQVSKGLADIEALLNRRITEAGEEDAKSIASATAAYKNHINTAESKAKEIYDKACEKREADYQSYVAKMQSADDVNSYTGAKDGFGKLCGYKDSVKNIEYCQSEIDRLNAERERTEAERKRQAEAAAARTKKIIIIAIASVIAVIVICNIVSAVIKSNKYKTANAMVEAANYKEAIQIFTELGEYKDVADQLLEAKYIHANAMVEAENHEEAIQIFTELGDYKDAADQLLETKYIHANAMVEAENYEEAIQIFTDLGEYKDSANLLSEIKFPALKSGVAGIDGIYVEFANKEWLVLESKDGNALLLSKYVIENRSYNDIWGDIPWEECTLRKWLNNDYLNSNFNESERNAIADNSQYGTDGGSDTVDKIFLLSIDEVYQYFTTNEERIALTAKGNTVRWWLRSWPIRGDGAYVDSDGSVDFTGVCAGLAVRPALWVDVSNL